MSATVLIGGDTATIDNYVWACDNPDFLRLLNTFLSPNGAGGQDPNPDLTVAQEVVAQLGGRIVAADLFESVAGRVY